MSSLGASKAADAGDVHVTCPASVWKPEMSSEDMGPSPLACVLPGCGNSGHPSMQPHCPAPLVVSHASAYASACDMPGCDQALGTREKDSELLSFSVFSP